MKGYVFGVEEEVGVERSIMLPIFFFFFLVVVIKSLA